MTGANITPATTRKTTPANGQIEWFDGRDLAVYSDRPRLFAKLWAIPGVRRHQTGDHEMRAIFPPEALEQVAGVIQARRRRPPGSTAHLQKVARPPVQSDFGGLGSRRDGESNPDMGPSEGRP
jgi:hypothetical protein